MMSLARIRANASNAQKSTGPRTHDGIKRSSQNATRHGLASTAIVVLEGVEHRCDYEELLGAFLEDLAPVGAVEVLLVERLAQLFWRLRRVLRFETEYLSQGQLDLLPSLSHLDAFVREQANRDRVLGALGSLFLPAGHVIEEPVVAAILDACLEVLDDAERVAFLGRAGEPIQILLAEASAPPFTVGSILDFVRSGEARLNTSPKRFSLDTSSANFIQQVYGYWAGADRQWHRMSDDADRRTERQRTEGLLLAVERAGIIERYEPRLRRDLSRTLSDLLALQAARGDSRHVTMFSPNEANRGMKRTAQRNQELRPNSATGSL